MQFEILPLEGKIKHIGQMITFVDQGTTEVQHRIRCAWSAFTKHRQELTSQSYRLHHRLHLFDAVVRPTITHGAGTWATAKEHEKCFAPLNAECFVSSHKKKQTQTRRKLEEKTFVTTKSARRLKKKTAHMMNAIKTPAFTRRRCKKHNKQ